LSKKPLSNGLHFINQVLFHTSSAAQQRGYSVMQLAEDVEQLSAHLRTAY